MRALFGAAVLSLMLAAPAFAQNPPATPPAQTAQAPAPAPRPFPENAKVAYINIQRIANESAEGKAATAKVQALNQKKVTELNEKNKSLQADQQKLQQGGTVMSDAARTDLEKKIERQQVDIQRATQDAQQEVQELQQDLQAEFQRKLMPIVQRVAEERGIHVLFSAADSGIVWADSGLDITADVIKQFDAATNSPTPKPQSPPSRH